MFFKDQIWSLQEELVKAYWSSLEILHSVKDLEDYYKFLGNLAKDSQTSSFKFQTRISEVSKLKILISLLKLANKILFT